MTNAFGMYSLRIDHRRKLFGFVVFPPETGETEAKAKARIVADALKGREKYTEDKDAWVFRLSREK